MFIYSKIVDKSLLWDGFSIPAQYHKIFHMLVPAISEHGENVNVKILIDGDLYDAQLKNIAFDQDTWEGHADIIQFRYSPQSSLSKKLRQIFSSTHQHIAQERVNRHPGDRRRIIVPEELQEFIYINATTQNNIFALDYVTCNEEQALRHDIKSISEDVFETLSIDALKDENTGFSQAVRKVRKLDKSIGDTLKKLYDYRCQLTGERIGDQYSAHVVEAHHIVPFTKSLNNDASNIIIVNPTFHRIIHQTKPEFKNLSFIFPNGVVEKVLLNKHL
jgi:Rad3-related DNA helicase